VHTIAHAKVALECFRHVAFIRMQNNEKKKRKPCPTHTFNARRCPIGPDWQCNCYYLRPWDIERRPGYDPKKRDSYGEAVYVAPAYSFTGGDFKEARPANSVWEDGVIKPLPYSLQTPLSDTDEAMLKKYGLKLGGMVINPPTPKNHRYILEKGWYIHPRTKERIETDY
jgi:hypothetical protein